MWKHDDKPAGTRRIPPFGKGSASETTRIKNHATGEVTASEDAAVTRRIPPFGKGEALPSPRIKNHPMDDET